MTNAAVADATEQDIPEAVQRAVDDLPIDPFSWFYDVMGEVFERYACDNEHCPSRPAWDIAGDDVLNSLSTKLHNAVNDVLTTHITRALVTYAAKHPDAPRAHKAAGKRRRLACDHSRPGAGAPWRRRKPW